MHDAAPNCSFTTVCRCDAVEGSHGNTFAKPYGTTVCGHTITGYRPGLYHFSFQAFVLRRPPPLLPPFDRDVETLMEDAAEGLIPLFLEPNVIGIVKYESPRR